VTVTLAFTEPTWAEIVSTLAVESETAGVIAAGTADGGSDLTVLGRRMLWVPEDAYFVREPVSLAIASRGYVHALKAAAAEGDAAVFLHSHPRGLPKPSHLDLAVDAELRDLFMLRTGRSIYISVIVAGTPEEPKLAGLIYRDANAPPTSIDRARIVGRGLQLINLRGDVGAADASATFDRQIRAFGREGQALLSQLRVGIAGVGGTGSSVCEQLVRLGVKAITVADDDVVDETNLTRIYGAGWADIGKPKVQLAAENAARTGLGASVIPIQGRVTNEAVARRLRHCDIIFGCTDDNAGRAVLSRLAYWYLIPVIDMGFVIASADGAVTGLYGRITTIGPGSACLFCRGRIDPEFARAEMLRPEERARLVDEGYAPGLGEPDPSVVAYTTMTASVAVAEMLERLIGFGSATPPNELLLRVHDRKVSHLSGRSRPGHYCADPAAWGHGDTEPFLGQVWI